MNKIDYESLAQLDTEKLAALEAHKDRMGSLVSRLRQFQELGRIDRMTILEAEYQALQAELWLAEAKAAD